MRGLHVVDLTVERAGRRIVDAASLSAEPGTVTALVGPNGAGKSTLLRGLAGLLPATGTVLFGGEDVLAMPRRRRARLLALVEQDARADIGVTVRQAVDLGRTPHRSLWGFDGLAGATGQDDAVETAMKRAGVDAFAERELGSLSGGEAQRVHLARALAQEPQVLFLDEPTNHLDIAAQLQTLTLVRELAADGITVVAALHDLNLAASFCDQVVVLADGVVRAAGSPETVLTRELIGTTYGVEVDVLSHPRTGRPLIAYA
ncbi:ATP-binding cassette domain-containing protein [Nocardioides sp.]|uniref:ABC transporter ATP-binding protein n=1 Tax=Nocardioides sp. TaxID=35761 RepID=UPI00261A18B1|nr:ATP-binding cassette domain-containing protein [Nocardioides sp.]